MKKRGVFFWLSVAALAGGVAFFAHAWFGPQYCWLAFGPEGKHRILVCLDGESVYVDRDGDGRFAGNNERFDSIEDCRNVEIDSPDRKTSYVINDIVDLPVGFRERLVALSVKIRGPVEYPQGCVIKMAFDPLDAPVAHFHGSLTIEPVKWMLEGDTLVWKQTITAIRTGDEPTVLLASIGTMNAAKSCRVGISSVDEAGNQSPFPNEIFPVAEVEFPGKRPGDARITKRYSLSGFC